MSDTNLEVTTEVEEASVAAPKVKEELPDVEIKNDVVEMVRVFNRGKGKLVTKEGEILPNKIKKLSKAEYLRIKPMIGGNWLELLEE